MSANIRELMRTGKYSQSQSVAIALRKAGLARPRKNPIGLGFVAGLIAGGVVTAAGIALYYVWKNPPR